MIPLPIARLERYRLDDYIVHRIALPDQVQLMRMAYSGDGCLALLPIDGFVALTGLHPSDRLLSIPQSNAICTYVYEVPSRMIHEQ
ncbi:hypothetical protein B0T17DRAFT_516824 [Bombardia bombarda]|uniref:Uncharacterized protein n=1 Tax=Bombardia bombarda TaxID=252184 RepID=A0AA39XLT0_9PEZI|nr:hypothetical protein B0T17DRAFT_516824 [Bombardia bombarda]